MRPSKPLPLKWPLVFESGGLSSEQDDIPAPAGCLSRKNQGMESIPWLIIALWLIYLSIGRLKSIRIGSIRVEFHRLGWRADRFQESASWLKVEKPSEVEEGKRGGLLGEDGRHRR
jgi:hypothetical protein